jgi:starch synthase
MYSKRRSQSLFYELPYSSISSFLSIETLGEETPVPTVQLPLSERFQFADQQIEIIESKGKLKLSAGFIKSSPQDLDDLLCFFRIRSLHGEWRDYEGNICYTSKGDHLTLSLDKFSAGTYEVTMYVRSYFTGEIVWKGKAGQDFEFTVGGRRASRSILSNKLHRPDIKRLTSVTYDSFSNWCFKHVAKKGFGKFFLESLRSFKQEEQELIFSYYFEALKKASRRTSVKSSSVLKAFRLLGVSEVLMVSPEGPHAMAGGLSQVITGLTAALMEEDCYVTIVSPLYAQKNGNHHESAAHLIEQGVCLYGKKVSVNFLGEVHVKENDQVGDQGEFRLVKVYESTIGKLRFLFIQNNELADRLYGGISGRDSIRRAVFLSQAALEIVNHESFGCDPDVIMTHDWTTSLVRPIQRLNPLYNDSPVAGVPVVHVLHNAGPGYQGRFNLIEGGSSVWKALGLKSENYGGFLEETEPVLNLSRGACLHNTHGIMTVSKPYAQQLINPLEPGELSPVLKMKRDLVFGISNGIPTQAVREAAFGRETLRPNSEVLLEEVSALKAAAKLRVQAKYQLPENSNSILAVLVGRLTEQKGLVLLTEESSSGISVLERMLEKNPNLQMIIAGPPSKGDQAFEDLEKLVKSMHPSLLERFKVRFEFVPHSEAIELTAASDLFLMPSKYEPGGIAQLEALAVGTSVVAHRVGGLSATLSQFHGAGRRSSGNSFLFDSFDSVKFLLAFEEACSVLSDPKRRIVRRRF